MNKFFKIGVVLCFLVGAAIMLYPKQEAIATKSLPFQFGQKLNFNEMGEYKHIELSKELELYGSSKSILFTPNEFDKYNYDYDSYLLIYTPEDGLYMVLTQNKMDSLDECEYESKKRLSEINQNGNFDFEDPMLIINNTETVFAKCKKIDGTDFYNQSLLFTLL